MEEAGMTQDDKKHGWALLAALLILALPSRAEAYIDPGSGSFLIQMLLAGLLAAGMTLKLYWRKLKTFFSRTFTSKKDSSSSTDE